MGLLDGRTALIFGVANERSLAWAIGEIPTLMIALVLVVQWARSDDREARRHDRAADRDGDADLAAYNSMLAKLAARDRTADRPGG